MPQSDAIFKRLNDRALAIQTYCNSEKDSILYWAQQYWKTRVVGSPKGTLLAKRKDLELFLEFFAAVLATDSVDCWTPSVTKSFRSWLQKSSPASPTRAYSSAYASTSINRILATLRHFARFVHDRRGFQAGNPFEGVKDLTVQLPEWNGLTDLELMRLRAAVDQLCQLQTRANQRPARNRATFVLALHTGLRVSEISSLDLDQYQGKYLVNVQGKGNHFDDVYLSAEARRALDDYVEKERGTAPGPLFLSSRGQRHSRQKIDSFFRKVAAQANTRLNDEEKIHLHPHKLRHTSVKRVHDERGPLAAKKFSRHRSFAQLERYATQTRDEHERMVDELFD